MDKQALRTEFLKEFIKNAPFDNCSQDNFDRTAKKLGLELDEHIILFPQGYVDVIDYWIKDLDEQLKQALEGTDQEGLKIREKIAKAVKVRLDIQDAQKSAFVNLYAYLALPLNKPKLMKFAFESSSIMWHWAGDTATDWNYYSKRTLLSYVYCSSILFWIQQDEKNDKALEEFIGRRIDEVMQIPKVKAKLAEPFENIAKLFGLKK